MSNIVEVATTRTKAHQSAVETLEEALADAKANGVQWCVVIGETERGVMRRWSGFANAASGVGGLELAKHALMEAFEEADR